MVIKRTGYKTLDRLLLLWLLSIAVMEEGFPSPPIPIGLAYVSLALAVLASLMLSYS